MLKLTAYHNRGRLQGAIQAEGLAYYYEHQAQFDSEMKDQARRAQEWAEAGSDSPGRERLRRLGWVSN